MGSDYSSPGGSKSVNITESEKSARNILEKIGKIIKDKASKDARKYSNDLKGNLTSAKFHHEFSTYRDVPHNPCNLEFAFHSNTSGGFKEYRHPCYGRQVKHNSKLEGSVCTNSKIEGNEKKINGAGACAPYRRRHICDLNLEHIDVHNVQNIHDLLGNILVTAKYEGESIVDSYGKSGTLNVCTALARSFADIGDIVRGKDLFLGNNDNDKVKKEKLQNNLKSIFAKIYKELKLEKNSDYKDDDIDGNYYKLREYWWNLNRDQVWEAITCSARQNDIYSKNVGDGKTTVSNAKCRDAGGYVSTNLDYVPQFLRWFEEWAEHFCPVRKYKLEKVREACRGKDDLKYCSVDGYDCKQTDRKKNIFYVNLECPNCEKECRSYKKWIENQEQEFNKQKNKYNNEINNVDSKPVNTYDETFYNKLKTHYSVVENFLETLKEGSQCRMSDAKHEINFRKPQGIFSRSEYCKACPLLGLECDRKGKCVPKNENDKNKKIEMDKEHATGVSTNIPILLNDGATNSIDGELETCSKKYSLFKGLRKQEWTCQYLNGVDHCMINKIENNIDDDRKIKFNEFFGRWLKYYIQDFNKVKDEINRCTKIQHGKDKICIKGCKNKCECVENWRKKKEEEWEKIKEHYNLQKKHYTNTVHHWVNSFLTHEHFSMDFINALEAFDNISSLKKLKNCKDDQCKINKIKNINEDLITQLLANLKKKIDTCKSQNDDNKGQKCCIDMPKSPNEDVEDDDEDEDETPTPTLPPTTNPCVESSGVHTTKTVTDVAKILHGKVKYHSSHISKLKAHAENGTYNRSGSSQDFKGTKLCNINQRHSNAHSKSKNPCNGKNRERFTTGQDWSYANGKNTTTYSDVYLPQRREHMCTSNLEYLEINKRPLNGRDGKLVNNSFLGDVLLAAKYESHNIKELYKSKTANDEQGVCRAVSRSFADIGDIIKGTDMWDNDRGSRDIERRLQIVFKNIKEKHDGIKDNPKYTDKVKFLDLRSDWWEANRANVWEAMQCAIKDFNTSTGYCQYKRCDRVPVDDYIPQRLRWMTEWAEWFCKMQKEEYNKLVTGCNRCWRKGDGKQCMKDDDECKMCKDACGKYKAKIGIWKKQWEKISDIYKILYKIVAIDTSVGAPSYYSAYAKDKHVIEFLHKLHKQNGGGKSGKSDTVYSTAEGYVHQELQNMECNTQRQFCKNKNGVNPANGAEDNEYAFRNYPNGYDDACACENNKKPVPRAPESKEKKIDSCKIAQTLIGHNNGTTKIGECKKKDYGPKPYPDWKCGDLDLVTDDNLCMPPRRQKLCIHFLAHNTQRPHIKTQDNLREAFIKSAAAETFFSWHYYKSKNDGVKVQNELGSGKIPEEYKRQMFYTFGDYRDFLFGTDISKDYGKESELKEKIDSLFPNGGVKSPNVKTRKEWWDEYGPQIWEAMLCALEKIAGKNIIKNKSEYNYKTITFTSTSGTATLTPLSTFAEIPQFLRWMTEWSEHFCKKQSQEYNDLKEKCTECNVSTNGNCTKTVHCTNCSSQCKKYEKFIRQWKDQWKQQSDKYSDLYEKTQKGSNDSTEEEKPVVQYLSQLRKKSGTSDGTDTTYNSAGKYVKHQGYINDCDTQNKFETSDTNDNNYPFREKPYLYEKACNCINYKPTPKHPEERKDTCKIVEDVIQKHKNGQGAINLCNKKEDYPDWDCIKIKVNNNPTGACIPPRRQKFCTSYITLQNNLKEKEDIRKNFITCAAIETYFVWLKYKEINTEADKELQGGNIPEGFKRQMYYTFGDYRDIFFGTDISTYNYISGVSRKVVTILQKEILTKSEGKQKPEKELLEDWWKEHGKGIWEGMLCGLTYDLTEKEKKYITEKYEYQYINLNPSLEEFSSRPQFLRWFTEWNDKFCTEREEKEKNVSDACRTSKAYEGCEEEKNQSNCVNACKEYKEYIGKKKVEYTSQEVNFNREKKQDKSEYENYRDKMPSQYLKEKCLDKKCNCIKKVEQINDYWTNPHKTYETPSLGIKCACPPSPCSIVDGILSPQNSKSYADGCKWKYGKMPLGLGWLCNNKEGGKEGGDVCIPPRRQRLYVKDLEKIGDGEVTQVQLREAVIKCAAIETFFAWHEFKKEKEKEKKEKKERDGLYILSSDDNDGPQKQLNGGTIPEEFKRQMFYTFGDYRDICLGKVIGSDMKDLEKNIDKVFKKGAQNEQERKQWWTKYEKDIWDGMVCALSYDTETKIKNEELRKKLIEDNKNDYKYDNVVFSGGFKDYSTSLWNFVKRPPFFRWLEEWADEFCQKKKIKIENIEKDCRGPYGENNCDDDGFDCDEMGRNEHRNFETLKCPTCAISCKAYKMWINAKKDEFDKQNEKYHKEIKKVEKNSDNIYDQNFIADLRNNYGLINSFLKMLKGPCANNNHGDITIDFTKPYDTFGHAKKCAPCRAFRVNCKNGDCSKDTVEKCNEKTSITTNDIGKIGKEIEYVDILVSDNSPNEFPNNLKNVCKDTGIFTGIKQNKWSCGYVCGLDICELKIPHGKKGDEQNILIRALFKRWLENFLEDYNKINDNISYCMNYGKGSTCINECEKKCKCVRKWLDQKQIEWENIKKRFYKQYKLDNSEIFPVKSFLQQQPFYNALQKAKGNFKDLNELEDSSECADSVSTENGKSTKKDVVECLLHKLKNKIDTCKKIHNSTFQECNGTLTKDPQIGSDTHDTPIPPGLSPPFCNVPANPCSDKDSTNVVNVEEVAKEIQQQSHKEMLDRSGKKAEGESQTKGKTGETESVLKGNISQSKLKKGVQTSELQEKQICKINTTHSNATGSSTDPCNGKGDQITIGSTWKDGNFVSTTHKEVYMPPRRQHFCTSNLEKLNVDNVIKNGNVNDTFLVDVLLAANKETERTKNHYKKPDEHPTACRAIRYSFADIGDIIKGTDMWDNDNGEKKTQENLERIFAKIKDELEEKLNGNYEDDNEDNKYINLRKDWWEANRDQIWEAMKCQTTSPHNIKCGDTSVTPLVDYIPQRLRWMNEWAEWYCKEQSRLYKQLEGKCSSCKSGKCETEKNCKECKAMCKEYEEKINPWKQQWEKIKEKYETLYKQAESADPSSVVGENERTLLEFLKKLKDQNIANNIYATAEGYVHQELSNMGCNTQNIFCHKNSDGKVNDKYVFRKYPYDHDDACICETTYPQQEVLKDPCTLVNGILTDKGETDHIEGCKKKYDETNPYPPWKCADTYLVDDGMCIPTRREKLCLHYLTELRDGAKEEELREAFIKCAAAETFLLWNHYKSKNISDGELLDRGIIPSKFLRSMFYTFGDYRDFFLGKDISKKNGEENELKKKIYSLLPTSDSNKFPFELRRKWWWDEYGTHIWEGMLCGLSHASENKGAVKNTLTQNYSYKTVSFSDDSSAPKLSEFVERPQFLRWYIEWSDEFCAEQKVKYNKLKQNCTGCKVETCRGQCEKCKDHCKKYQQFIIQWKDQWTTQSGKYAELYEKAQKDTTHSIENKEHVLKYLSQLSKRSGANNRYSTAAGYMEKEGYIRECVEQKDFHDNAKDDKEYAFREYPNIYNTQCTCNPKPLPPPVRPKPKKPPPSPYTSILPEMMSISAFPLTVGIAFAALSYFLLKKKSKSSVDLLRVLNIPKGEYEMPTLKSKNSYIPYRSGTYKGKTYIYMEGDSSGDEDKYIWDLSSSDITSSESEYEEMDINDIYVPGSPKYKTLIEVVLEPSKRDIPSDDTPPTNKFTDEEWNELKNDFISQYLPNTESNNNYISGNIPMNTEPNTLYFDNPEEKPFITSIHDRDLYTGEEIDYNINMVNNDIPMSDKNGTYTGIDLINDTLSGEPIDIYDEVLKRKENELYGTKHPKRTSNNSVAKNTNNNPIMNQLDLFHTWLDRHRDMCEQWNNKEDILNKLNEEWNKDNDGGNVPIDNKTLNTNVSIQIDMDHGKPKKEFTNMDTYPENSTMDNILDDLETHNEPFYDIYEDDMYYDVNDDNKTSTDHNNLDVSSKVQIEMDVNTKLVKEKYPISDVWDI
ncbi:erythrocyte membrane protein 1, PfEMP1, putative [Plasmodium sp. gorilla clade G1]|nr:erythrocyte membrane protein 1, PfEMP1, putative [Plasmodium sp. gorilla clade G1]